MFFSFGRQACVACAQLIDPHAAESLKASYIILSRLRVWQPQSWCDLSTHTHRVACKKIGSGADLPWISKDLKRSHTRAEIKECLYMTNGNTFQKKSQDRAKKSPGWIKPLTLILKKNQKDSGLILKIKGRFKFDFRLYGSVNSSCAEPAPPTPRPTVGYLPAL